MQLVNFTPTVPIDERQEVAYSVVAVDITDYTPPTAEEFEAIMASPWYVDKEGNLFTQCAHILELPGRETFVPVAVRIPDHLRAFRRKGFTV